MNANNFDLNFNRFLHFGCWNNLNKDNNLRSTMATLNRYIGNNANIDFVSIAGDNYYPEKNKDKINKLNTTKKVYIDRLKEGFDLLPKSLRIYMTLGNHDLETNTNDKNSIIISKGDTEKKEETNACSIVAEQEHIVTNMPNIELALFYAFHNTTNETLILMIDTSLYTADANEFEPCYHVFLNNNDNDISDLQNNQNNFILETVNRHKSNVKNIIITGHHPILQNKYKKEKVKQLIEIPHFIPVLNNIYNIFSDKSLNQPRYYYLCADLHMFQYGTIKIDNMKIEQYIVGTGGTKLDDITDFNEHSKEIILRNENPYLSYKMTDFEKSHGFLDCSYNESGGWEFNFIRTENENENESKQEGGNRKKNKTKKKKKSKTVKKKKYKRKTKYVNESKIKKKYK